MDDNYNNSVRAAQEIHEKARYFRGRFLNSVAVIEREIALILTDYFCTSDQVKKELFFINIATAPFLTLNNKKDILIKIVRKDYPRYWSENEKILRYLDNIMRFRNKLAHSVVDVSEDALKRPLENGVGFIEWDKGEPITDAQFQDWEIKVNAVSSCLSDIKHLLPFKEKACV
ncbi:hypothetical protein Ga0466249_002826 [Sporomusaceae bacterium BoRhaA]|uniref:hypothetical protein n=1 Tax=Pelorhabdus rhamnosifermentans TaxID=2772457 RepID=UPI001C06368C|nr:hypothetical protein [Pelorhabdus rhamnosifermentans]MBU2701707.1 hypothetical protein [Pelorhabdus rhamnosifermentans]